MDQARNSLKNKKKIKSKVMSASANSLGKMKDLCEECEQLWMDDFVKDSDGLRFPSCAGALDFKDKYMHWGIDSCVIRRLSTQYFKIWGCHQLLRNCRWVGNLKFSMFCQIWAIGHAFRPWVVKTPASAPYLKISIYSQRKDQFVSLTRCFTTQ